jgi:hypothetical protein
MSRLPSAFTIVKLGLAASAAAQVFSISLPAASSLSPPNGLFHRHFKHFLRSRTYTNPTRKLHGSYTDPALILHRTYTEPSALARSQFQLPACRPMRHLAFLGVLSESPFFALACALLSKGVAPFALFTSLPAFRRTVVGAGSARETLCHPADRAWKSLLQAPTSAGVLNGHPLTVSPCHHVTVSWIAFLRALRDFAVRLVFLQTTRAIIPRRGPPGVDQFPRDFR